MTAQAQTYGDEGPTLTPNTMGLVYEDAINENLPGKVNIQRVNYKIDGIEVVANVYTPAGYDAQGSYAAIIVAHPNGGSKDQVAGLYAQKLAEAGFITIAFDARYQGESGGMPRRTDKPANRIGDIMGAIDYIQQYPGVDPDRIGGLRHLWRWRLHFRGCPNRQAYQGSWNVEPFQYRRCQAKRLYAHTNERY